MLARWIDPAGIPFIALACAAAALVAFFVSPLCRSFAALVGAVDVPADGRRIHKKPMPRLGGLAIFAGFIVTMLLFADLDAQLRGILIGAVIIVVLGCIDDVIRLHYFVKLLFQFTAALVAVLHGLTIEVFSNPIPVGPAQIHLGILSAPITILWIVALTNAVNLIDGLDGLACGVSLIGSLSLLIIALAMQRPEIALIMAALSGGCLGFLPFNVHPAKMFMGDTGATFLGFILAAASIQGLFKVYTIISFAVPFLILALPIFDTVVAVFRRLLKGSNPAHADRGHLHHRLIDMGFSQKQAVALLYAISAVMGITAVVLTTLGEVRAILVLLIMAAMVAIGYLVLWSRISRPRANGGTPPGEDPEDRPPRDAALPAARPEDDGHA
ncbi:MAG: undecaprenyl/decaprenyl-phosphate alpha-N-acetylglucosaminyl 1-phosphate transferase [Oscillospiraceae bacterium]|nr:undecaprenyl/decaprenyl-phosphate alpha-N-acetylglucosaminyl 1-phosphate transferase [Oscillospiraceae bacterium]